MHKRNENINLYKNINLSFALNIFATRRRRECDYSVFGILSNQIETTCLRFRWKVNRVHNMLTLSELQIMTLLSRAHPNTSMYIPYIPFKNIHAFLQFIRCQRSFFFIASYMFTFHIQFRINEMITGYCIRMNLLIDDFFQ